MHLIEVNFMTRGLHCLEASMLIIGSLNSTDLFKEACM